MGTQPTSSKSTQYPLLSDNLLARKRRLRKEAYWTMVGIAGLLGLIYFINYPSQSAEYNESLNKVSPVVVCLFWLWWAWAFLHKPNQSTFWKTLTSDETTLVWAYGSAVNGRPQIHAGYHDGVLLQLQVEGDRSQQAILEEIHTHNPNITLGFSTDRMKQFQSNPTSLLNSVT